MPVLNLPRLVSPRLFVIHPSTGRPVSNGSVTFYVAGTTTLKDVFADRGGESPAANPVALDAAGSCEVFLSGAYRIEVKDQNGSTVYTADQINSTPVELPEGNPGSFIIANNLSEGDPAIMRDVLALTKQSGTFDATDGRVLLVGAGGLLGAAGALSESDTLDQIVLTGWRRVTAAQAASVGAPSGAGAGLVEIIRFDASNVVQVYHPVSGTSPAPWRRMKVLDSWTTWLRDWSTGSGTATHGSGAGTTAVDAVYSWEARNDGSLVIRQTGANFVFFDTLRLQYDWKLPVDAPQFLTLPHVTASFRGSTAQFVGTAGTQMGVLGSAQTSPSSDINMTIWCGDAASPFESGDSVENVRLRAEGRWR